MSESAALLPGCCNNQPVPLSVAGRTAFALGARGLLEGPVVVLTGARLPRPDSHRLAVRAAMPTPHPSPSASLPAVTVAAAGAKHIPRRPEETALHLLVQEHLEAILAHASASYTKPLPRYVERAFRTYLECGLFSQGFLRWHRDTCRRDPLVAFSCKGRGVCPSCSARRMCNTAAQITDRVLPAVPLRQWVLSLPFEIRRLAAFRADVAAAAGRLFVESIAGELRREYGKGNAADAGEHGAIVFLQRFGGSLNLNLHLHVLVLDGLFAQGRDPPGPPDALSFHDTGRPSAEAIERVAHRTRDGMVRWLRRKGLLDERGANVCLDDRQEPSALEACAEAALRPGAFGRVGEDGRLREDEDGRFPPRRPGPMTADVEGFNVQAAVRVEADDDVGREQLVRYCARPCFALERLRILRNGQVAYRVKVARRGKTHRIMTPVDFLARLAALIPPPRYPLIRYHGVLAPHSRLRSRVVPRPTRPRAPEQGHAGASAADRQRPCEPHRPLAEGQQGGSPGGGTGDRVPEPAANRLAGAGVAPVRVTSSPETLALAHSAHSGTGETAGDSDVAVSARESPRLAEGVVLTPQGLSVAHLDRLVGEGLLAVAPRLPWAQLLRRTYGFDVLACAGCGGRLQLLTAITDKAVARAILSHLGRPADELRARTRDPTVVHEDLEDDWDRPDGAEEPPSVVWSE